MIFASKFWNLSSAAANKAQFMSFFSAYEILVKTELQYAT